MTAAHAQSFPTTKMPGESVKAYEAFQVYCNLGTDRSHALVSQQCGKHVSLIGRWSAGHFWRERLETYVAEQRMIQMEADSQAALERARKMQERRALMEEDAWDSYQKTTAKLQAMLAWPLARRTVQGTIGADAGATVVYEPMQWRLGDVARLGQFRELMRRLALGEAVSAQEMRALAVSGNGQGSGATATITFPGGAGVPTCLITIEGAETEEDEIIPLPASIAPLLAHTVG